MISRTMRWLPALALLAALSTPTDADALVQNLASSTYAVTDATASSYVPIKNGSTVVCADNSTDNIAYCGGAGLTTANGITVCRKGAPSCDYRCFPGGIFGTTLSCRADTGLTLTLRILSGEKKP